MVVTASSSDVKLLGAWASSYSDRIQFALNLKRIEYEYIEETFNPKSELLLKSNPVHKKIPVFFHANNPISESHVILEYIDEVWSNTGPSILPSDPLDRAITRFWASYVDAKVSPALDVIAKEREDEKKKAAIQEMREALGLLEDAFVKCSKGKGFFGGNSIGYVDMALGSLLAWLRVLEEVFKSKMIDEVKTPNLFKWALRFCSDDAVKDVMPRHDRLLEFVVNVFLPKFT